MPAHLLHEGCSVATCDRPHLAKSLCRQHYYRERWAAGKDHGPSRQGNPRLRVQVGALANGEPCIVAGLTIVTGDTLGVWISCPKCCAYTSASSVLARRCDQCDVDLILNNEEMQALGFIRP